MPLKYFCIDESLGEFVGQSLHHPNYFLPLVGDNGFVIAPRIGRGLKSTAVIYTLPLPSCVDTNNYLDDVKVLERQTESIHRWFWQRTCDIACSWRTTQSTLLW
jgi:hypothetical protein